MPSVQNRIFPSEPKANYKQLLAGKPFDEISIRKFMTSYFFETYLF